jgi:excisionase family DNA binding protein
MNEPKPKPSAMAELKTAATAFAHHLMKPPAESFEVRARCRQRTLQLLTSRRLARRPCEACGAEPVQAHHENYRRPDHVRWLCRRCHDAVHHRGAVLPAKLPMNPTNDELCRYIVVLGLETVVLLPDQRPTRPTPPTPQAPKLVLTLPEAAAVSGLSQAFLKRAIKDGRLPAEKDRGWRIRRKDLEAL